MARITGFRALVPALLPGYAEDVRTFILALSLAFLLNACSSSKPVAVDDSKEEIKQYHLHGEIKRLDPQGHIAAIQHEKIGDWMEAMTMEFPVKNQADYDKLQIGETIDATVYVQGLRFWVADVTPAPAPAATAK